MRRALAALLLFGCAERDPRWSDATIVDGPLPVAGQLAFVNRGVSALIAVDPQSGAAQHTPTIERVRAVAATATELLLIGGDGARPKLQILGPKGEAARALDLPGAYDRLEVSPDGRHAIALYDPALSAAPGAPAARNANEIAIIDVAGATVRREVLGTSSLAPRQVLFAGDRAAILLDKAIALVDLAATPAPALRVPLELGGGASLSPAQALFSPDGTFLFVRATSATDVLALELGRAEGALTASINFLSVSGASVVRDIAIAGTSPELAGSIAAIFEASEGTIAALLDRTGDASKSRQLTIGASLSELDVLGEGLFLVHGATGPRDARGSAFVAGWEPLSDRSALTRLSGSSRGAPLIGAGGVAFFEHDAGQGSSAVAITALTVDARGAELALRTNPVLVGGYLAAIGGDPARAEVYLGVTIPRKDSGAAPTEGSDDVFDGSTGTLVVVRSEGLEIVGVALDLDIIAVGVIGDVIYASHRAGAGDITFLPRDDLRRERARRSDGFLLGGLFEGGER